MVGKTHCGTNSRSNSHHCRHIPHVELNSPPKKQVEQNSERNEISMMLCFEEHTHFKKMVTFTKINIFHHVRFRKKKNMFPESLVAVELPMETIRLRRVETSRRVDGSITQQRRKHWSQHSEATWNQSSTCMYI